MLVGREAEQRAIEQMVTGARVGQSGVLVLTGEAGIGKTALLEHALHAAAGMRVLRSAGSASETDVAFAGLLQLLRPTLTVLDSIPAPQAEALAVALALREGVGGDRFAIGAAALSLLSRWAEEQPVLVLVDDVHDLDRPSVEALAFVARRLLNDPIALLATARPQPGEAGPLAALPHLELSGLPLEDAAGLLAHRSPTPVASEVLHRLHQATGGNPLALLELAVDVGALDRLSPEVPVPVPDVVAGSFARRAEQLDSSGREALLLAAVADGDLAVLGHAAATLGVDVADLAGAESVGLVTVSPDRVRFRHPLVRSSVYAAAPAALRRQAHRAVADALPAGDLERRSWHLVEAAVGFDEALATDLEQVAERARNRSAYAVAATAQERSGLLTADYQQRARRLFAAAESAWLAGQTDRALELLGQTTALTTDPHLLATVDGLRGSVAAHTGSLDTARDMLTDAARRLAHSDPSQAARLLSDAVATCLWLGDVAGALEAARLLDELAPRGLDERAGVLAELGTGIAQVLAGEPGIGRIRAAVERQTASTRWADDPRRPGWPVLGVLFLRESGSARELLGRAVEDLRARTALVTLPNLLMHTARDEATSDRWQTGAAHYEECIALARETGQTTELTMALAGLAGLQARMGREGECRANAEEARVLAERYHVHLARAWAQFAHGDLELGLGRPQDALSSYEALVETLEELRFMDVDLFPGPELAEALTRLGRVQDARTVVTTYHRRAEEKGQPWARARAERARGALARAPDADRHFRSALALHRLSPDVYEEARTQLAYGSALRRWRRRVEARPLLRAALGTFERVGAAPWAEHAAHELSATGETPHRRGDTGLTRLTPQELQISRMLAEGRTTRETAAALFLSPKTVEYHLRHVYTKLDIHSRSELAEALRAADPTDGTAASR